MATAAASRKSSSIHDYPAHLNPFHEEDNDNKIRFWTIGRKLTRSNSINFSGLKDLKNSWALRSFMKKGKKRDTTTASVPTPFKEEASPIVYRRSLQYSTPSPNGKAVGTRITVASPEKSNDRYIYGGSYTPLPRSRFQERLRSPSQHEVNTLRAGSMQQDMSLTPRLARSEVSGSRLSIESTNPFDEAPIPPVRASRRKKKKAPLPPSANSSYVNGEILDSSAEIDETKLNPDLEVKDLSLNIELKIVEDDEVKKIESSEETKSSEISSKQVDLNKEPHEECKVESKVTSKANIPFIDETDKSTNTFAKINIGLYRRNSTINENDVLLRNGKSEEFTPIAKRSKSLSNAINDNNNYVTCDVDINIEPNNNDDDPNGNVQKVVCKLYDDTVRKQSIETVSSTEKEFIEIDKATKELEREINKLNLALHEEEPTVNTARHSVNDIRMKFENPDLNSPNPIPKPKRRLYNEVNGKA